VELIWVQFLLQELRVTLQLPSILWYDNIDVTFLASNRMFHAYTKHVEIDYHFMRERVISKQLIMQFLCYKDQIVDIMNKALTAPRFGCLKNKLTFAPAPSTCGGAVK
jgi:hypothetical protein